MYKQYQVPSHSGVPNPWGPRLHNWKGGELNEGSLYHGPIYTRPSFRFPWVERPLQGIGQTEDQVSDMVLLGLFGTMLRLQHPEVFERMDARMQQVVERGDREEYDAYIELVADCVREKAPRFADAAEGITLEDTEGDVPLEELLPIGTGLLSQEQAQAVEACVEGRGAALGILLPLLAIGALMIWLHTRNEPVA